MLSDDRSEVSFKCRAHAIAAVNPNEAAAIGVKEVNLGVPAGLIDPIDLEAGRA
jgi:hypothetical protein